jgi:shikimate kinase
MKIFLIGLPGSGKTTLGKKLAVKLGLSFFDLDLQIEQAEQSAISEIFSKKGEDYFRKVEAQVLSEFCTSTDGLVLSTGGGAPCFHGNLEKMNAAGQTVFLDVPSKEIMNRLLRTNLAKRPLFAKMNPEEFKDKIEFMRSQRMPYYQKAKLILKGAAISVDDLADKIRA